jgi:hypothetical protein
MNSKMIAVAIALGSVLTAGIAGGEPAKNGHAPSLVDIMLTTQSHHTKLWLAGNARNWDLADYQLDEMKEGLEDAAKDIPDYKGVPVGSMINNLIMPPIEQVEAAIKAKDRAKFVAAYDKVTAACNQCHVGSNRGFIVIQRPSGTVFPNQSFGPKRK